MMPYILHAGLILAGCLIFYKLLLHKETFYRVNRFILLSCLVLSFTLPLIRVPQQWSFRKGEQTVTQRPTDLSLFSNLAIPEDPARTGSDATADSGNTSNLQRAMQWVVWLYWFGVVAFALNFLLQVAILYYKAYTRPVIRDGRFRIVELSGDKAPCSFGNNIFINPEKYDWDTYNQILLHEKIHIAQGHSLDIVLAEIILIFQWFNPFAWLYRKELENNLEFLTDDQLLHNPEVEKTSYQMSLLKVSAPHFPLSVTTNYNQSLLKKRLLMMNAKRSNMHTAWRYFFILPMMVLFVCLLNEPASVAQTTANSKNSANNKNEQRNQSNRHGMDTEGAWFATIKDDKISIQFKNDQNENQMNSSTFLLSEIKNLPKEGSGTFTITRDAGIMEFTGRFEANAGMGRYKFTSEKSFADFLKSEGIDGTDEQDMMAYFIVDVKRSYIQELKELGYKGLGKNELLPLAALKIDRAYIESLKKSGFSGLGVHELISMKAMGIASDYIDEIRTAGYKNITAHQLVSFKAQGINGKFISDMRNAAKQEGKPDPVDRESADDLVAFKAMHVDPEYIKSLSAVGLKNLSNNDLVAMKAQGITAEYIKSLHAAGFKPTEASQILPVKAQNITPEFVKGFASVGYKDLSFEDAIPLKALGVTPEFIRSFQEIGVQNISPEDAVALKAQGVTPVLVKEYHDLGYKDASLEDIVAAKATGTTPTFIASMREKGHNLKTLHKYIQLKTAID